VRAPSDESGRLPPTPSGPGPLLGVESGVRSTRGGHLDARAARPAADAVRIVTHDRLRAAPGALPPPVARAQAGAVPHIGVGRAGPARPREMPDASPNVRLSAPPDEVHDEFPLREGSHGDAAGPRGSGRLVRAYVDRPARPLLDDRRGRAVGESVG